MIYIFDFDGVIISPIEDAVFRFENVDFDTDFIARAKARYGLCKQPSLIARERHILLQEVLYERGIPCEPGPEFEEIRRLKKSNRAFYVLTARAGPGAVQRAMTFLEKNDIRPEEVFFIGPVDKCAHIRWISEFNDNPHIMFYDDTKKHIDNINEKNMSNVDAIFVDNNVEHLRDEAMALYEDQYRWLKNA